MTRGSKSRRNKARGVAKEASETNNDYAQLKLDSVSYEGVLESRNNNSNAAAAAPSQNYLASTNSAPVSEPSDTAEQIIKDILRKKTEAQIQAEDNENTQLSKEAPCVPPREPAQPLAARFENETLTPEFHAPVNTSKEAIRTDKTVSHANEDFELWHLREKLSSLQGELEDMQRALGESHSAFAEQMVEMSNTHDAQLDGVREDAETAIAHARSEAKHSLDEVRAQHERALKQSFEEHKKTLEIQQVEHKGELEYLQSKIEAQTKHIAELGTQLAERDRTLTAQSDALGNYNAILESMRTKIQVRMAV